jgi:hypothetical protein
MKNPSKLIVIITFTFLVCTLVSFIFVSSVSAQGTSVRAVASINQLNVGDTLTVTIKISNVQNLFGVDITLSWNPSVLSVVSATSQLGVESHSGGVLHETSSYQIEVVDDTASQSTGQYHLLATSTGSATPFYGSGNIAILSLADHPAAGGNANLIIHTDTVDAVSAVISGTSTTPIPTSTPESSITPQPSASVPEFSNTALIAMLIVVISATVITISTKISKNRSILSSRNATNL